MTAEVSKQDRGENARDLPGGADEASLRAAVAANRSWRGVLRAFGITAPRHALKFQLACDEWGIDYSHFGSRTWTDDQLCRSVSTAGSWRELMTSLGYPGDSGSGRATIRKHAARLGLDLASLSEPPVAQQGDPFAVEVDAQHLRGAGAFLVAGACALRGYRISWPLEPARYHLLVDTGSIQRVQVKTTTWRLDGEWACKITHLESSKKAWYTAEEIDYFGIVDWDLAVYMIPVAVLDGLGTIVVRRYEGFRLGRVSGPAG